MMPTPYSRHAAIDVVHLVEVDVVGMQAAKAVGVRFPHEDCARALVVCAS
ncbi:MAG: hypothetical protein ACLFP4_11870 [Spirochaetales bacterium]